MTTRLIPGPRTWSMTRDAEGHRTYRLTHMVEAGYTDGPAAVLATSGLPRPGDLWLIDGDVDIWAYCRADANVTPVLENEKNRHWQVEQTFSSKPPASQSARGRCQDDPIEDPLLEPARISGGSSRYTEELTNDVYGKPILNSAHQQQHGPQLEFDRSRPTVRIEVNVASLNLGLLASLVNCINSTPMWGLPARTVQFSNYTWDRRFFGQCYLYYNLVMEFDIRYETFDRYLADEGDYALSGHWDEATRNWVLDDVDGGPPDPNNPAHFEQLKDVKDNPIRAFLDGQGSPVAATVQGLIDQIDNTAGLPRTVTTQAAHGLSTNDVVVISGAELIGGAPTLATDPNGVWVVTVTGATTFTLNGSTGDSTLEGSVELATGVWRNLTGTGRILVQGYRPVPLLTLLNLPVTF